MVTALLMNTSAATQNQLTDIPAALFSTTPHIDYMCISHRMIQMHANSIIRSLGSYITALPPTLLTATPHLRTLWDRYQLYVI